MSGTGGPETGGKDRLKAEYNREERIAMGGYRTRKPSGKNWLSSRRILLLDLVIILFFTCVLYPLVLKRHETRFIEGYTCTIKFRKGKGLSGVEIFVKGSREAAGNEIMEIALRDKKGGIYHEWIDAAPKPGETRTYMKAFENGKVRDIRFTINDTEEVVPVSRFQTPFFLLRQKD